MDETPTRQTEPSQKQSLKEFIDDYQKTLASIGVLIVLGVFWRNMYGGESVPYISYLCFFATIPLFFEIAKGYNYDKSSWNLRAFSILIIGVFLQSTWYVLASFPEHDVDLLSGVLWSMSNIIFAWFLDKTVASLNRRSYDNAVRYFAGLDGRVGLTVEAKTELKTIRNSYLQSCYKRNRILQIVVFGIFFIGCTIFIGKLAEFVHGLIMDSRIFEIPPPK